MMNGECEFQEWGIIQRNTVKIQVSIQGGKVLYSYKPMKQGKVAYQNQTIKFKRENNEINQKIDQ